MNLDTNTLLKEIAINTRLSAFAASGKSVKTFLYNLEDLLDCQQYDGRLMRNYKFLFVEHFCVFADIGPIFCEANNPSVSFVCTAIEMNDFTENYEPAEPFPAEFLTNKFVVLFPDFYNQPKPNAKMPQGPFFIHFETSSPYA